MTKPAAATDATVVPPLPAKHARLWRHRGRPSLGRQYAKLWTATAVSTAGDGIRWTALPLLAATLTRDPLRVSTVVFAAELPWLLFALAAGALLDRWDRRRVMCTVDAARALLATTMAVSVLAGWASIPLLAILAFLLGSGQTLFDTASQTIVPALVSREPSQLERANGRIDSVQVVGNNLAGPPAGGLLYALVAWVPFAADAGSFLASAALVAAIRGHFTPGQPQAAGDQPRRRRLRTEIAEGLGWLWTHRLLRTLAVLVGLLNLVGAAWGAPLVLFAQQRLGLDGVGYGLLSTGLAVGAVLGGLVANRLSRLLGPGRTLLGAVAILGASTGVIGLLANPWLVGAMLAALGFAGLVWNVITVSLRQAIVPDHLFGRVNSVYKLFAMGALPLGALLGGTLARTLGLATPFLVGGAGIVLAALLALPLINTRAIQAAHAAATTQ